MVTRLAVLAMLTLYGCATTQPAPEEVGPPKPEKRAEWFDWPKDTGGRIATTTMLAFGAWLLVNYIEGPDDHNPGPVSPPACLPSDPVLCR